MSASLRIAAGVAALCFVCFNLNGREIGSYDSQPLKFLAREIMVRHALTLDATVAAQPAYAQRPGFVHAPDGHYRPAFSIVSSLAASVIGGALWRIGAIDPDGPLSANLIAKLTASLLASVAVFFAFLTARRWTSEGTSARVAEILAVVVAIGFGLGTNVWPLASQTLWQHESVLVGIGLALFCLARPREEITAPLLWIASLGLGIAGAARPQTTPAIAVLSIYAITRRGRRSDAWALVPVAILGTLAIGINVSWFGHPLGAVPLLESLHPKVHNVTGSIARDPWWGALGLLFSPSRGLVIFSPIVAIALLSWPRARREGFGGALLWCWLSAIALFTLYACYSVWWGGHTYGPRYMVDILPLLVPLAAAGAARLVQSRVGATLGAVALAWSILIAATGAFCYPQDAWNTDPESVDQNHARLWDWRDPQFVRCWHRGRSPQNFDFFHEGMFTAPDTAATTTAR
jgi:hypothetical protein